MKKNKISFILVSASLLLSVTSCGISPFPSIWPFFPSSESNSESHDIDSVEPISEEDSTSYAGPSRETPSRGGTSSATSPSSSPSTTPSSSQDSLTKTQLKYTYNDFVDHNIYPIDHCPSTGNPKLLIIPVWFTDSENYISTSNKETVRSDIETAYFGTNTDNGWRSVKTYYNEISHGELNLTGVVTDWYSCNKSSSTYFTNGSATNSLVTSAVKWYKTASGDNKLTSFDTDGNGHLDGVMLIYGAPDYGSSRNEENNNMWAYCYWLQNNDASKTAPTPNVFFWASYDFMYSSGTYAKGRTGVSTYGGGDTSHCKVDSHTYIHEMGHVLGLDDYYDYSGQYSPAGSSTMQDYNVGGHDPYSRMALGWADPYVPTTSTKLTIKPFETSGDLVLLSPSFSDSPFDEYILIELYTNTGVQELDSKYSYSGGYPQPPSTAGIRIWHIDARLLYSTTGYFNASNVTTNPLDSRGYVTHMMGNTYWSNSESDDYCSPLGQSYANYNILQYIRKSSTATYKPNDSISSSNMFKTGDTFSMSSYGKQFVNTGLLNSKKELGFTVKFTSVSATGATLEITKA